MENKKMNILHFTIDYNENLGAFQFLKRLDNGLSKYNVEQQILILGERTTEKITIPNSVFFCHEIDVEQFFSELDRNTILIFHESFATYARHDRQLPENLYELSLNFKRIRMIHDYSTAVCPRAIDIDVYKDCKGTINASCLTRKCVTKEVYDSFVASLKSLADYDGIMCLSKDTIRRIASQQIHCKNVFQIPPLIASETDFPVHNHECKKILYASRISNQKGLIYLIEALGRLKEYPWELQIAGSPEEKGYYLNVFRLARKKGIEQRIKLLGYLSQEQLREVRRESDILCFPSIGSETYGFSGAEAVLSGVPVVAFDIDGVNEWLTDGVTGFMCRHMDAEDMSRKLECLLTDEKLYNYLRNNCMKAAQSNDLDEQVASIYEFLRRIRGDKV